MTTLNNKGYLLLEAILAVGLTVVIMGSGLYLWIQSIKDWYQGESYFEIRQNSREAISKLTDEIRESHGVEIVDSASGWIKVYKTYDKSQFTSFKIKKNKLFIGYNNILNPNSELANYINVLKVEYLPEGVTEADDAKGVKIYMQFAHNKKTYEVNTSIAFRCKQ